MCTLQGLVSDEELVNLAVLPVGHIQSVIALIQHQAVGNLHLASGQAVLHLEVASCTVPHDSGVAVPICHKD